MVAVDSPLTHVVHTACTLDCPDACSLAVTVTSTEHGPRITNIDASPVNPFTDSWICAKVISSSTCRTESVSIREWSSSKSKGKNLST